MTEQKQISDIRLNENLIFDRLDSITNNLAKMTESINAILVSIALAGQSSVQQMSDTAKAVSDIRALTTTLFGEQNILGLIANVARHESELSGLKKLVWVLVGALTSTIISIILAKIFNAI